MYKSNYKFLSICFHPLLLLTILLLTVGTNFYSASPALAQSASISGVVVDVNGTPLAEIRVIYAFNDVIEGSFETTTNDAGEFIFSGLSAGEYELRFFDDAQRFVSEVYPLPNAESPISPGFFLGDGETLTGLTIEMGRRSSISGFVTDANGRFPYKEKVIARRWIGDRFTFQESVTAISGRFTFSDDTREGLYQLEIPSGTNINEATFPAGGSTIPPQLFEVTTDGVEQINIQVERVNVISGVVADSSGSGLANISVTLYRLVNVGLPDPQWQSDRTIQTDAAGRYIFEVDISGPYRLGFIDMRSDAQFLSEFHDNVLTLEEATDIFVPDRSVANIDVQLENGASISGTVTNNEDRALSNVFVTTFRQEPDGGFSPVIRDFRILSARTDVNGQYSITPLQAGTYRLAITDEEIQLADNELIISDGIVYRTEFYNDATDLQSAANIALSDAQSLTDINVTMSRINPTGGSGTANVTNCSTFGGVGDAETLADALATSSIINFDCTGTIVVPEILVSSDLIINGREGVILDGNNANRVLSVASGAQVEVNNLILEQGSSDSGPDDPLIGRFGEGGNIYNAGILLLNESIIRNGDANVGGGIYNIGKLIINNVLFNENDGFSGGGINNLGEVQATDMTIRDHSLNIFPAIHNFGDMVISGCLIENITSNSSWAIDNDGTLTMNDCLMREVDGGILNSDSGVLTLNRTTIDSADSSPQSAINNSPDGTISLANVTISNSSGEFAPLSNEGEAFIENTTLSGNFGSDANAILNSGSMEIKNSTVATNGSAEFGDATDTGILNNGTLMLWDTIVADQVSGSNCGGSEPIISNGYNLDSDGSCDLNAVGDMPNGNANLGPLQDNGGPTFTHALLTGSDAIDAGNCSDSTIRMDQRDVDRPQGAACDIGAFEATADAPADPERDALVALYNSTDGDNWIDSTNWLEGDYCDWFGITCDLDNVIAINLIGNELNGTLPPELVTLSNLQALILQNNQISGGIPPELGNLTNLVVLQLADNPFGGPIPAELGNLSNLDLLFLRNAQLSGPIPTGLGNLVNLTELYLDNNELSGSIPPELSNLSNLSAMYLSQNQLSGTVPLSFSDLSIGLLTLSENNDDLCTPLALQDFVNGLGFYDPPAAGFCQDSPPPTQTPNGIEIEAESGLLSGGFTIGSDENASGGAYIFVPQEVGNRGTMLDPDQRAEFTFTIEEDGIYRFAGIVNAPNVMNNSFYITVDDFPSQGYTWHNQVGAGYTFEYVTDGQNIDMVERVLTAGEHTLTVYLREPETRLDKIIIERVSDVLTAPMPEGCDGLVREAEAGDWEGMFTVGADENASGGFYLHVPEGLGSRGERPDAMQKASYCFTVDQPGTYRIKAWAYADNEFNNSFFVTVNDDTAANVGANEKVWHVNVNTDYAPAFVTTDEFVNGQRVYPTVEVTLDAGVHTVYFFLREDGTRLDKVALEPINMMHKRMRSHATFWPDGAHTFLPFLSR